MVCRDLAVSMTFVAVMCICACLVPFAVLTVALLEVVYVHEQREMLVVASLGVVFPSVQL
jgi:hypothetical protein